MLCGGIELRRCEPHWRDGTGAPPVGAGPPGASAEIVTDLAEITAVTDAEIEAIDNYLGRLVEELLGQDHLIPTFIDVDR